MSHCRRPTRWKSDLLDSDCVSTYSFYCTPVLHKQPHWPVPKLRDSVPALMLSICSPVLCGAGYSGVSAQVFSFGGQDNLATPKVCPLGHTRQEIRYSSLCQCLDLHCQAFFQQNTARGIFIILPRKTFRSVSSKCTSRFYHFDNLPYMYG